MNPSESYSDQSTLHRINLLPWRETKRQERQRDFVSTLAFFMIIAVGTVIYAHMFIEDQITFQKQRNDYINQEIITVQKKIEEVKLLKKNLDNLRSRMDIVQRLQVSRPEIVHLFDEIPRLLPEGVFLINLKQKDQSITVEGVAQSNARVSTMMRNITASSWIAEPNLDIIQITEKGLDRISRFTLRARQTNPMDKKPSDTGIVAK